MKNNFDIMDEMMIMGMLNDYLAECIQEQIFPQSVINEMIKSKEKLSNLFAEVVIIGVDK